MEKFRKHGGLFDFYLNDIHENNFILNNELTKTESEIARAERMLKNILCLL